MIKKFLNLLWYGLLFLLLSWTLCAWLEGKLQRPVFCFGYKPAIVQSTSMEPYMKQGAFILIKQKSGQEIKIGEVVLFQHGRWMVTHRVIGEDSEGFITKGDKNQKEDERRVKKEKIEGRVVMVCNEVVPFFLMIQRIQLLLSSRNNSR